MSDVEGDLRELVRLSPEGKQRLVDLKKDIRLAKKGIAVMKEMGMDASQLETELNRYEKTRDVLLREFAD